VKLNSGKRKTKSYPEKNCPRGTFARLNFCYPSHRKRDKADALCNARLPKTRGNKNHLVPRLKRENAIDQQRKRERKKD
jgi:hypothetical protein